MNFTSNLSVLPSTTPTYCWTDLLLGQQKLIIIAAGELIEFQTSSQLAAGFFGPSFRGALLLNADMKSIPGPSPLLEKVLTFQNEFPLDSGCGCLQAEILRHSCLLRNLFILDNFIATDNFKPVTWQLF